MSIRIQFGTTTTGPIIAEPDKQGLVTLPPAIVSPAAGSLVQVLVHRIVVRASGDPAGVKALESAYGGEARPLRTFDPPEDLFGSEIRGMPMALRVGRGELPPGTYVLTAVVDYRRGEAYPGQPQSPITTARHERHLEVPPDTRCWVSASWTRREAIVDRTAAELEITAERLPRDARVEVSVLDPTHKYGPELRAAINAALRQKLPVLYGEADPAGRTTFRLAVMIQKLDAATREAVRLRAPVHLDLLVRTRRETRPASEGRAAEHEDLGTCTLKGEKQALVIDFNDNVFDGFPILDLGTSSVFAVIHYSQMPVGFLSLEQEQTYRAKLSELLARKDGAFGTPAWAAVLAGAARRLVPASPPANPAQTVREYLQRNRPTEEGQSDTEMYRVLHALESNAATFNGPPAERLAVRAAFARIHAQAFGRFPLRRQRLIPVDLDRARQKARTAEGEIARPIPSTTEVLNAGRKSGELRLDIGEAAHENRREAMRTNPETLQTRFHASPKLYYDMLGQAGETVKVSSGGDVVEHNPRDFLVAALISLRERIDAFRRDTGHIPTKRFNRIVLTFPTSAKLNVRTELLKAAQAAGFDDPKCDLDEALSAIVFHLIKPFGDDKEMGLEAFRTACRPVLPPDASLPREWLQNVLLVDVGGGTTDIALVEAKLTDESPPGHNSALGRYYRLVPTLLGATGRGQLAGNLLTLYLYHDIKKRLADAVLSSFAKLNPSGEEDGAFLQRARAAVGELRPPFGANGEYAAGSLIEQYDTQQLWQVGVNPYAPEAYRLADRVVSTVWHEKAAELKPASRHFQELWDLAEHLKVTAFETDEVREFRLEPERLAAVLGVSVALAEQLPPVVLTQSDILAAVDPPLGKIAEMAVNLVASRLTKADPPTDPSGPPPTHKTLDRIILTGRTCRLPRVKVKIAEAFRRVCDGAQASLRWDPAQIVYEDDYAKQAAAIGASYAQVLREHRVPPTVSGELVGNQLDVDIDNLFFSLPCGFRLRNPGGTARPLLPVGRPFRSFDENGVGHLESAWCINPSEVVSIDRFDYEGGGDVPWGELNCRQLCDEAQMSWSVFQEQVLAAMETDHRLIVTLLFCRGPVRHYALPQAGEWNLARRLVEGGLIPPPPAPPPPAAAKGQPAPPAAKGQPAPVATPAAVPAVLIPANWLKIASGWVLVVNEESQYSKALFTLGPGMFDRTFRTLKLTEVPGALSEPLPPAPESGIDHYSVRPADGSRGGMTVGSLRRPTDNDGKPVPARVVLTARGELLMQVGEPVYKTSDNPADLQRSGVVVRRPLGYPNKRTEDLTDPFCGRH